jgi:rubrerythrin
MGTDQYHEPAAEPSGERIGYRCSRCSYGIVVAGPPPPCPFCRRTSWVRDDRPPATTSRS